MFASLSLLSLCDLPRFLSYLNSHVRDVPVAGIRTVPCCCDQSHPLGDIMNAATALLHAVEHQSVS